MQRPYKHALILITAMALLAGCTHTTNTPSPHLYKGEWISHAEYLDILEEEERLEKKKLYVTLSESDKAWIKKKVIGIGMSRNAVIYYLGEPATDIVEGSKDGLFEKMNYMPKNCSKGYCEVVLQNDKVKSWTGVRTTSAIVPEEKKAK